MLSSNAAQDPVPPQTSAPPAQKRVSEDNASSLPDSKRLKTNSENATPLANGIALSQPQPGRIPPSAQPVSSYTPQANPGSSSTLQTAPPIPQPTNIAQPSRPQPSVSQPINVSNRSAAPIPVNGSVQSASSVTIDTAFPPDDTFLSDPEGYIKGLLLPTLDQVALSVIEFATRCSVKQLLEIYENPSSHTRRALDHLHSIFLRTRENFMTSGKYLDVAAADRISSSLSPERARQAYRNTNMASAIFILLIPTYQTMKDLQFRLGVAFEPLDQFLRADNMELAAGLLTQVHQSQMREASYRRVPTTDEPLSRVVENSLVGSIQDDLFRSAFWQRCQDLRHYLMNHSLNEMIAADCRGQFLRYFRNYLRRYLDPSLPEEDPPAPQAPAAPTSDLPELAVSDPRDPIGLANTFLPDDNDDGDEDFDINSSILNAARLAQKFMEGTSTAQKPATPAKTDPVSANVGETQSQDAVSHALADLQTADTVATSSGAVVRDAVAPEEGNSSTSEQYERVREVAAARAREKAAQQPPPTSNSSRRPWTKDEEQALMHGLDRVKGPHWSQILAMYGPGGSVSEVLRDRNQVQLKDKARNIKLFFLKQGHPVPAYLQDVTGELKTRAPAWEKRNEFDEHLQRSSGEDKATLDAINALAGAPRDASDGHGAQDMNEVAVDEDTSEEADVSDEFKREFEEAQKSLAEGPAGTSTANTSGAGQA